VGRQFGLAAQTQANSLLSKGSKVIACRASSIQEFDSALIGTGRDESLTGLIDGGVSYYGHSGYGTLLVNNVAVGAISALYVGQERGIDTNITSNNVYELANVTTAFTNAQGQKVNILGPNASIFLNGCAAGADVFDYFVQYKVSIAQLISLYTERGVYAYEVGTYFSQQDAAHAKSQISSGEPKLPSNYMGPLYVVPNGVPGRKPPMKGFSSNFTPPH
jgi:hypothetical protein